MIANELAQFHFLRPWWLLALLPAGLLIWMLWRRRSASGSWQNVIAPHLLPHLLQGNHAQRLRKPWLLLGLCWLLAVIALAGPTWRKLPQAVQKKVNAQVIVLDLSFSMYAQDVSPSRLERAKYKLSDILRKSREGLTGLIVFAGTPHVVTPLTDDTRTVASMVNSLSPDIMPIPGSDPVAAVLRAKELLKQGGLNEGHIVLISDEIPADFASRLQEQLDTRLTPVSVFAIGTAEGSPIALPDGNFVKDSSGAIVIAKLDKQRMQTAAADLNGYFSNITHSDQDIDHLLARQNGLLDHELKDTERNFNTWDDLGYWLVILMLPIAALGYRKGWLGSLPLILLLPLSFSPNQAEAGLWENLWLRADQQGQRFWQQKNYPQAAQTFKDPGWRGSALYRSGNYEAAAEEFAKLNTDEGHYNRGNALANQQKFNAAIEAYEQALALNPRHADAQANLDLLKQFQQQQEQQQSQQNQQQDSQQQKKQPSNQQQPPENSEQQSSEDQKDSKQDEAENNQQPQQDPQPQDQQQSSKENKEQQSEQQNQQSQNQQQPSQEQPPQQDQVQAAATQPKPMSAEDQQALKQWLERIPDDPGGLLRRKFKQESNLRNRTHMESQQW